MVVARSVGGLGGVSGAMGRCWLKNTNVQLKDEEVLGI